MGIIMMLPVLPQQLIRYRVTANGSSGMAFPLAAFCSQIFSRPCPCWLFVTHV
jgi:hypothetical protein